MSQSPERKLQSDGQKGRARDALDEKLKQLGEDFLEEQVPEALLDALRRAAEKKRAETQDRKRTESGPRGRR